VLLTFAQCPYFSPANSESQTGLLRVEASVGILVAPRGDGPAASQARRNPSAHPSGPAATAVYRGRGRLSVPASGTAATASHRGGGRPAAAHFRAAAPAASGPE
jgi:hypothetical protein